MAVPMRLVGPFLLLTGIFGVFSAALGAIQFDRSVRRYMLEHGMPLLQDPP
jgi:hypothetical protein